ncbi:MAG: FliI/YscN family ATPase [Verrucomicrobiota bacterium]
MKRCLIVNELGESLRDIEPPGFMGKVTRVVGLTVESEGPPASLGEACVIYSSQGRQKRLAEVVGFRNGRLLLMPWDGMEGVAVGDGVQSTKAPPKIASGQAVLGRVVDSLGHPIDDLGQYKQAPDWIPIVKQVPDPANRPRIENILETGVRAIDAFATVGIGQRMGIFAGSGVGKSSLLGMVCRYAQADVNVIALIGERGREVMEFVERDLGPALKKSVVVVATSDQPALARIKAAFAANSIANHFRQQGKHVLLMVDSLTRFAMAQREVGLAIGEPPATRGYPPSVFTLMPLILEQAGNSGKGAITGFYTVLTEGDDWNDPVSDCARSILDGHILLARKLASENHYPAIDVLESLSRLQLDLITPEHKNLVGSARHIMAIQRQYQELVDIGAYTPGSNTELDYALQAYPRIVDFLRQSIDQASGFQESLKKLSNSIGVKDNGQEKT